MGLCFTTAVLRFVSCFFRYICCAGLGASAQVNLPEEDIRSLCLVARDVFLDQPCLLQLATPIKICGESGVPERGKLVVVVVFVVVVVVVVVVVFVVVVFVVFVVGGGGGGGGGVGGGVGGGGGVGVGVGVDIGHNGSLGSSRS